MYEQSSTLRQPEDSLQPLWRYLSADRLKNLLSTSELFFPHLVALEDKNEGALTQRTHAHLVSWFQAHNKSTYAQAQIAVDQYLKLSRQFYVNCWHMNDHESYLMWKAYAGRGYAIKTSFERIRAAFEKATCVINGGVVEYVDFKRDATLIGNVFNHVVTKDKPYSDEREFRLVFWEPHPSNREHPKVENGVRVPVNISMLIQSIVASPFADPMDAQLEQLMAKNGMIVGDSTVAARIEN